MSKKIDNLLEQSNEYDVLPVVKLRPLLSPPRTNEADDPTLWALFCPNHSKIEIIDDQLTKFPTVIKCNGRAVVVVFGAAIWIGRHLFEVSARPRLLKVLSGMFGDDVMHGHQLRWIESPGVTRTWEPVVADAIGTRAGYGVNRRTESGRKNC